VGIAFSTAAAAGGSTGGEPGSERFEVGGRGFTLLTTFLVETDLLTLVQATKASTLDRGDMNEDILRTVIRLNEAIPFLSVEPLDRSL
jgi:hypothetical protein